MTGECVRFVALTFVIILSTWPSWYHP